MRRAGSLRQKNKRRKKLPKNDLGSGTEENEKNSQQLEMSIGFLLKEVDHCVLEVCIVSQESYMQLFYRVLEGGYCKPGVLHAVIVPRVRGVYCKPKLLLQLAYCMLEVCIVSWEYSLVYYVLEVRIVSWEYSLVYCVL